MAEGERRGRALRPLLRALHRDLGYAAVGMTLIYALSGLAVNHIGDWDPSFQEFRRSHELGPLAGDDAAIARQVAERLDIAETPRDLYRAAPTQLDVVYAHRTLHVDPSTGHIADEGQEPRVLLRVANWLHMNRGKKAWTYIADAYAAGLLLLAVSGLFMIKGRKGLLGRGLVLVGLGLALPIAYVTLSGGP